MLLKMAAEECFSAIAASFNLLIKLNNDVYFGKIVHIDM